MRTVVMAAALAGLACGSVSAQNVSTGLVVSLTFDRTSYAAGEVGTATIMASWNGVTGSYFSSMNIDLVASSESIQILSVAPIAWNNPALGSSGTPDVIDGASIIGLQAAQFSLIPPFTSTNPIQVTTFTFVRTAPEASLTYSAEVAAGAPFPFSVTGPIFSDPVVEFGTDAFVSGRIPGIPSPAGVTGLTIAGLIGLRRRR